MEYLVTLIAIEIVHSFHCCCCERFSSNRKNNNSILNFVSWIGYFRTIKSSSNPNRKKNARYWNIERRFSASSDELRVIGGALRWWHLWAASSSQFTGRNKRCHQFLALQWLALINESVLRGEYRIKRRGIRVTFGFQRHREKSSTKKKTMSNQID